jgi:hypothetical protein
MIENGGVVNSLRLSTCAQIPRTMQTAQEAGFSPCNASLPNDQAQMDQSWF